MGEPVTLTGVLENADECTDIVYVWEVNKGNGYEIVEDATGSSYTFLASIESLRWDWRLTVYYR